MKQPPSLDRPHRRYNPLADEWVLVSAQRTDRPWQGAVEAPLQQQRPRFDPECYLCPGTTRAGGVRNDDYAETYVFTNDFPALIPGREMDDQNAEGLFRAQTESGTSRVICFSPRHDLTLAQMEVPAIERVIDTWSHQFEELGEMYQWVQVFENKGAAMGASNPHPHGQIWAGTSVPSIVAKEDLQQADYFAETGKVMLEAYAIAESSIGERLVVENDHWRVVVPYWAVWPFEAMILPRRHVVRLPDLETSERAALATALRELLVRYDNLFNVSFPYSMGWHGAPFHVGEANHWQLHAHLYPPLLRSATVRKFMVGYELLAEPQRDLTAELAAARLRDVPAVHYLDSSHAPGG